MGPDRLARYGYFDPSRVSRLIAKLRPERASRRSGTMLAFIGITNTQIWHAVFVEGESFG